MVREALSEEVTFELTPGGQEGARMCNTGGGGAAFWAEGTAGAKALKWK